MVVVFVKVYCPLNMSDVSGSQRCANCSSRIRWSNMSRRVCDGHGKTSGRQVELRSASNFGDNGAQPLVASSIVLWQYTSSARALYDELHLLAGYLDGISDIPSQDSSPQRERERERELSARSTVGLRSCSADCRDN